MMAVAITAGFVLALTRKRAENVSQTDRLVDRTLFFQNAVNAR